MTKTVSDDDYTWLDTGDDDHLAHGGHESWMLPILMGLLPEDGVFLDVGAHVGLWSVRLAKQKASRVFAVEANILTAAKLKQNAVVNGVDDKIAIFPLAASATLGLLGMVDPNGFDTGGSTTITGPGNVLSMPLDDLISRDHVDLIKMDVEGYEVQALLGMELLLRNSRPNLVLEMHGPLYPDREIAESLEIFFADIDYEHSLLLTHCGPDGPVCEYWLCQPKD